MSCWTPEVTVARPEINKDDVRRFLGMIMDPGSIHAVRGIPSRRLRFLEGDYDEEGTDAAEWLSDDSGTFVTLNPLIPGTTRARDEDISCRRHLLIDCDRSQAVKAAAGSGDTSATDREKAACRELCGSVLRDLDERGFPKPLVIDSGNGFHLVYRVDLPNDPLSREIIYASLKNLAAKHNTNQAEVDTTVCNASRITKLPGTWVRKGVSSTERPHRLSRIVSIPNAFTPVSIEQLQELAGCKAQQKIETPPIGPLGGYVSSATRCILPVDRAIGYLLACQPAVAGQRGHNQAFKVAVKVGPGFDLPEATCLGLLKTHFNARCDPPWSDKELEHKVSEAYRKEERRGFLRDAGRDGDRLPPPVTLDPSERLTIQASKITPRKVDWLWANRVPRGFVTIFAGQTGLGKSFVTCDFIARVTQGRPMPDGTDTMGGECQNVLFVSEDPYDCVLVPRLMEAGADLTRVSFLSWKAMEAYHLSDTDMLERMVNELGNVGLIVIDPPTNFLGEVDDNKNVVVRAMITRIIRWLDKHREIACVFVTHHSKGAKNGAVYAIMGAAAWGNTTRVAHSFSPDTEDEDDDTCLFTPSKNNLGKKVKGLRYRIVDTASFARVEWLGDSDVTADEALAESCEPHKRDKQKSASEAAGEWLIARFAEALRWPSADLEALATRDRVSHSAMFAAKKRLGIRSSRERLPDGNMGWVNWVAPGWDGQG